MKKLFKLILYSLLVCAVIVCIPNIMDSLFPKHYADKVEECSEKYGVDKNLIYAIIKAESNFAPSAVSSKGAKGLMQLMDETGEWCSEQIELKDPDLLEPAVSIEIGTFYISYLLKMYNGNEKTALAAYNAGHGNVDKWLENVRYSNDGLTLSTIPYNETEKYVNRIMNYKKVYAFFNKGEKHDD